MGFYGNITNTSNTTFSFDRIYPNRLSMDANANNDGIFIGRYVLVEYDQNAAYPNIYIKIVDGETQYFSSPGYEAKTRIQYKDGGRPAADTSKDVFYLGEFGQKQETEKIYFYMCDGYVSVTEDNKTINYATFKQVTAVNTQDATPYLINHNIDYDEYKNAKGYDSTVWTKVSEESNGKLITRYRNIADLNSVVPAFDLETDAPTMTPIIPHFDADSTNVYYKLHTQPQWGLRVAEKSDETNSDGVTTWLNTTYDPITDTTITHKNENVIAAINYNGPAFEEQVDKNRKSEVGIKKHDNSNNYITILPTGESGQKYYTHTNKNGEKIYETAPDIQEMRISLPAIGNMMSDAWDIIHGPLRNDAQTDENSSLQGRLDSFKTMEKDAIPMKRNSDGTFVGSRINNNTPFSFEEGEDIMSIDLFDDKKGYENDDPWIRTTIYTDELDNTTKLTGITIHHTHHEIEPPEEVYDNKNTEDRTAMGDKVEDTITLTKPVSDAAGHIVGMHNTIVRLPFGYKTIKTNGRATETSINTNTTPTTTDVVADNTQDTLSINSGNKWVRVDTNATGDSLTIRHDVHPTSTTSDTTDWTKTEANTTIPVPTYTFDNAGHYESHHTESYKLPFAYGKIKGDSGNTAATATYDELSVVSGDAWIDTSVSTDKIMITHTGPVATNAKNDSNKTPNFGDTFTIEDWVFDNKGHKANLSTHTVKIPKGSLNDLTATSSSVLTGISMIPETGVITQSHNDVGKLALTGYTVSNDRTDIGSGDTINSAFAKLQNQISYEESRINTILNGTDDLTDTLDTFIELQNYITEHGEEAADMAKAISDEASRAKGAESNLTTNLNGEITRATNAETTLNTRITNLVGNTSVSAQITAFGNTLGTAAKSDANDFAPAGYYDDRVLTSVYEAKIASLESTIAALEARIEALESPVSE